MTFPPPALRRSCAVLQSSCMVNPEMEKAPQLLGLRSKGPIRSRDLRCDFLSSELNPKAEAAYFIVQMWPKSYKNRSSCGSLAVGLGKVVTLVRFPSFCGSILQINCYDNDSVESEPDSQSGFGFRSFSHSKINFPFQLAHTYREESRGIKAIIKRQLTKGTKHL